MVEFCIEASTEINTLWWNRLFTEFRMSGMYRMCMCIFFFFKYFANFLMWIHLDESAIDHHVAKTRSKYAIYFFLPLVLLSHIHHSEYIKRVTFAYRNMHEARFPGWISSKNEKKKNQIAKQKNCIKLGLWLVLANQPCICKH